MGHVSHPLTSFWRLRTETIFLQRLQRGIEPWSVACQAGTITATLGALARESIMSNVQCFVIMLSAALLTIQKSHITIILLKAEHKERELKTKKISQ